jgi:hypothetical protein
MDGYTHLGGNPDLVARFIHGTKDGVVALDAIRQLIEMSAN